MVRGFAKNWLLPVGLFWNHSKKWFLEFSLGLWHRVLPSSETFEPLNPGKGPPQTKCANPETVILDFCMFVDIIWSNTSWKEASPTKKLVEKALSPSCRHSRGRVPLLHLGANGKTSTVTPGVSTIWVPSTLHPKKSSYSFLQKKCYTACFPGVNTTSNHIS